MALFLGVDGGQSGTAARIGDETGRVLGSGEAGPCNHAGAAEGRAKLERAVTDSVRIACAQGGLDPATVSFDTRPPVPLRSASTTLIEMPSQPGDQAAQRAGL